MAFPQVATSATTSSATSASSLSANLPSSIAAGDLLLLAVAGASVFGNWAATGWTSIRTDANDGSALLGKIATGSEGATVTVTCGTAQKAAFVAWRITGWRGGALTTSELSYTEGSTVVSTPDPPNHTPSWGAEDNLWIAIVLASDTGARAITTYPTNYGSNNLTAASGTAGSDAEIWAASRELNASSENPGVFTLNGAVACPVLTVAVRPAGAVGGNTSGFFAFFF